MIGMIWSVSIHAVLVSWYQPSGAEHGAILHLWHEDESCYIAFHTEEELRAGLLSLQETFIHHVCDDQHVVYACVMGDALAYDGLSCVEAIKETWQQEHIIRCGWGRSSEEVEAKSEAAKPFYMLPLSNDDKKNIRDLISCMAEKSPWQLLSERKLMTKKADKIRPIHPLRFAGFVLVDPIMKRCMQMIRDDPWKWAFFIDGYIEKMDGEAKAGRLLIYVPGFAECVSGDAEIVQRFLLNRDYEGFFKNFL